MGKETKPAITGAEIAKELRLCADMLESGGSEDVEPRLRMLAVELSVSVIRCRNGLKPFVAK